MAKSFQLYQDQQEFVDGLRAKLAEGYKSILGVASPAFGKTVVAGHIIATARERNHRASAWFLVHRRNLLNQTSKSFWGAGIEHGLLTSGRVASRLPVQVGTIGTVVRRLDTLKAPTILFCDEAHLARANSWQTVIEWAQAQGSIVIGLTGTPVRLDGKALGNLFQTMVEARPTSWLIQQGRLSDYRIFSTPLAPDLSGVRTSMGDYAPGQAAEAMQQGGIMGDAVQHWLKHARGMRTVAYCCTVAHSQATAAAFNAAGIPAAHVDASTTQEELRQICMGLADGTIKVLCNCELVIEGFDLSAQVGRDVTLECCILLRPTQSLARYLQMIFRALRRKPQAAIILDHAGCAIEHGLPDDPRDWSLDDEDLAKQKKAEPGFAISQCKKCFAIFKPHLTECLSCGAEVKRKVREIEAAAGELQELDKSIERRQAAQEQGRARGLRDLVQLALKRDHKNPSAWAAIVFYGRQKRRPTPAEFRAAAVLAQELRA